MEQPIRILQVFASLDRGGAETMIMNLYRKIDKTKVQFDFIVNENQKKYDYESEIIRLGGRVFYVPRCKISNYLFYKRTWRNLLNEHPEWNIIHGHHTSVAFIYLSVAKSLDKVTIAHSHTAGRGSKMKSMLKVVARYPLRHIANYLFACSDLAAKWMFGKYSTSTQILNNSIDGQRYIFSIEKRQCKRKELNIEDKFVIGHIGNFSNVKNYPFILDVFKSILKQNNNSILMLIGKDKNDPEVENKVKNLGFDSHVIFTGVRADIPELLQAMDVFLMPSLYEGLPVTLIEAQASGLKCIISDNITHEVKITNQVEFVSLNKSSDYWADQVLKYSSGYERRNVFKDISDAGYDISENAKRMENFYITMYSKCHK